MSIEYFIDKKPFTYMFLLPNTYNKKIKKVLKNKCKILQKKENIINTGYYNNELYEEFLDDYSYEYIKINNISKYHSDSFKNISENTTIIIVNYLTREIPNDLPNNIECLIICSSSCKLPTKYPENLKYLYLRCYNQDVINLPNKLKYLHVDGGYNKNVNDLPKSLKFLYVSNGFYGSLEKINLKFLKIHNNYKDIINFLPKDLNKLEISTNNSVKIIHDKITHLYFMSNVPIYDLPDSITHLTFGYLFDQCVDNLPKNLTHLKFGERFCQPVDNLPESLTHIIFGGFFSRPVDKLPKNLKYIKFGEWFGDRIKRDLSKLPPNLTHLIFDKQTKSGCELINLPKTLSYLDFGRGFHGGKIYYLNNLKTLILGPWSGIPSDMPENLEKLIISNSLIKKINTLPKNLTYLAFADCSEFNQPLNNLPVNLTYLKLGENFNQPLNNLPVSLIHLKLGEFFNNITINIPTTVEKIKLYKNQIELFKKLPFNCVLEILEKKKDY